jgi:DNA-binding GntR family transcriptional regulator
MPGCSRQPLGGVPWIIHNYAVRGYTELTDPGPGRDGLLAPRALYQEVADRLRERIFARELEPGSWIDELKLAADFGISRTPLREALKVLAVEGLVTMKLRRGAYVTEMSRDDVRQVYHLLGLLESDAAAEVAAGADAATLQRLQALHETLEQRVQQREAFFAANEAFHLALLDAAGNRWRRQIVADLRKVMKLNRHHSLFRQGRLSESLAEHRALMAALLRRDAATAAALMQQHFRNGLAAAGAPGGSPGTNAGLEPAASEGIS